MMWTRKELKEQAKEALRRNYWKIVLVSALMLSMGGGVGATGIGGGDRTAVYQDAEDMHEADYEEIDREADDGEFDKEHDIVTSNMMQDRIWQGIEEYSILAGGIFITAVILFIVFLTIFLVVFILVFAVDVFLFNPFSVGVSRFMLKSVYDKAEVKEIAYGFDHSYKNIVKTMFHRDLQIFLWALLFIVPGIYKKYQYRMVPYIMAEYPDMEYRRALQMSEDMMYGHKWKAFVLDVSFIPWHFLGTITCGILEIFYVQPYQHLTGAALYRRLSGIMEGQYGV